MKPATFEYGTLIQAQRLDRSSQGITRWLLSILRDDGEGITTRTQTNSMCSFEVEHIAAKGEVGIKFRRTRTGQVFDLARVGK